MQCSMALEAVQHVTDAGVIPNQKTFHLLMTCGIMAGMLPSPCPPCSR